MTAFDSNLLTCAQKCSSAALDSSTILSAKSQALVGVLSMIKLNTQTGAMLFSPCHQSPLSLNSYISD